MGEKIGRREQKKLLSRKAILDAAVRLFSTRGVKETAIADITKDAGLGIGTFYNYYNSKEEVLLELLENIAAKIRERETLLDAQAMPVAEELANLFLYATELLSQNRYVLPLFARAAERAGEPEQGGHEVTPSFKGIFERLTIRGQQQGEFRTDIPAAVITEMFHSLFQAAAFSRLGLPFAENIRLKMTLIIDGMRAKAIENHENTKEG